MAEGLPPGMDADESIPPSPAMSEASEAAQADDQVNSLAPNPGEESADALVIYPRARYLAARRGITPREEFARDIVAHVRAQSPHRIVSAAAAAAILRRA